MRVMTRLMSSVFFTVSKSAHVRMTVRFWSSWSEILKNFSKLRTRQCQNNSLQSQPYHISSNPLISFGSIHLNKNPNGWWGTVEANDFGTMNSSSRLSCSRVLLLLSALFSLCQVAKGEIQAFNLLLKPDVRLTKRLDARHYISNCASVRILYLPSHCISNVVVLYRIHK